MDKLGGLTPRQIVDYLDKYIVGQKEAKKAVAIALRNRRRRQRLAPDMAKEVTPKNILMVGPTGVGKTEIARRLANLIQAPFVKVEATKYTEVGYVGRDVESMVRDLAEVAEHMIHDKLVAEKTDEAREAALERMVDFLVPSDKKPGGIPTFAAFLNGTAVRNEQPKEEPKTTGGARAKMRRLLDEGKLDDREVEIELVVKQPDYGADQGMMMINPMGDMLKDMMPTKTRRLKVKVKDGLKMLQEEEADKLIDSELAAREGLELAAQEGIIFIDELDKVVARGGQGADVSREGVQRDLLPIVEGSVVRTKYGPLSTDHILFIAAGAFAQNKPSDLIPELQGRLPLRVELDSLGKKELARILTEPKYNLLEQYKALLSTEGVTLQFEEEAIDRLAELAEEANKSCENIGARRLHTLVERLLEDLSFSAEDKFGETVIITREQVDEKLTSLAQDVDLRRYLL